MVLTGTPIIILREGSQRTQKRDALQSNINVAKILATTIKSSFGPRGLDKMLIDPSGNITITNDGATILKRIDVQHPGAKFVIDLAITQDQEVGDGTSTVVLLTGEFLRHAEELLDSDIHPSIIIEGFKLATERCIDLMQNLSFSYDNNRDILLDIAKTSMSSKIVAQEINNLSQIVVDAVTNIQEADSTIDIDNIKLHKATGGSLIQTSLIDGFLLKIDSDHEAKIRTQNNLKILISGTELDIHKTNISAKIQIDNAELLSKAVNYEENMLEDIISSILKVKPGIVFTTKSISDKIKSTLERHEIFVQKIDTKDAEALSLATGATIIASLGEISRADLGTVGRVETMKISDTEFLLLTETPKKSTQTILVRGGTEFVLDEYERSIHDAICVVRNVLEDDKLVYGGGATEIFLLNELRRFKLDQPPKIQLAIEAFARGLESLVAALAVNAGLEPIEEIGKLNQKYSNKEYNWGIDPQVKGINDMDKLGVIEPSRIKIQALTSASEAVEYLLRVDDIISTKARSSSRSSFDDDDDSD